MSVKVISQTPGGANKPPNKRSAKTAVIITVSAAIIGGIGAGYYFLGNSGGIDNDIQYTTADIGAVTDIDNSGINSVTADTPALDSIQEREAAVISALENGNFSEASAIYKDKLYGEMSDEMEQALSLRFDAMKTAIINGTGDAAVIKRELETIDTWRGVNNLKDTISSITALIDGITASGAAYETAQAFFANGDFARAAEYYEQVIQDDINYENARNGIIKSLAEYKKAAEQRAAAFAENKDFTAAAAVLEEAVNVSGPDAELTVLRESYLRQHVTERIAAVTFSAKAANDYDGGITTLRTLLNEYPSYSIDINPEITKLTAQLLETAEYNITPASLTMIPGESAALTVTSIPAEIKNITTHWSSSDSSTATVDANGTVTAQEPGIAQIILRSTDGTILAVCDITSAYPVKPVIVPGYAVTFAGNTYAAFDVSVTWEEAKTFCEELGGYLVTITSQAEQDFIADTFLNNSKIYWTGGYKNTYGEWKWVTDEPFVFTDWIHNQPDNAYGVEDRLEINFQSTRKWNDRPSGTRNGYICEWDGIHTQ